MQWVSKRARGRAGDGESTATVVGARGGERRRRRRCRASGDPWSGGEEEGVEAELLSWSGERGVVGDDCYGERWRRWCSVGRERERGRAGESEWGVGEVGATTRRRSTRRNGDQGDAERLGGAWRARARHAHLPACSGEGKQLAGTGQHSAGPAGLGRTGRSSGKLLPLFIFCFLFYLIYLQLC